MGPVSTDGTVTIASENDRRGRELRGSEKLEHDAFQVAQSTASKWRALPCGNARARLRRRGRRRERAGSAPQPRGQRETRRIVCERSRTGLSSGRATSAARGAGRPGGRVCGPSALYDQSTRGQNFVPPSDVQRQLLLLLRGAPGHLRQEAADDERRRTAATYSDKVTGMALQDHPPVTCAERHASRPDPVGDGSPAESNLERRLPRDGPGLPERPLYLWPTQLVAAHPDRCSSRPTLWCSTSRPGRQNRWRVSVGSGPSARPRRPPARRGRGRGRGAHRLGCGQRAAWARADEPEAFARVTVDAAELRTGPGVTFRVIYIGPPRRDARPRRPARRRASGCGCSSPTAAPPTRSATRCRPSPSTRTRRARPRARALFAPPPLTERTRRSGHPRRRGVRPAETGGMHAVRLHRGPPLARPRPVRSRSTGSSATSSRADGSEVLYGGGVSVYLAPVLAPLPFLDLGGGGLSVIPNSDSVRPPAAGLLRRARRRRVSARLPEPHPRPPRGHQPGPSSTPRRYKNAQTFAGGLGVYF